MPSSHSPKQKSCPGLGPRLIRLGGLSFPMEPVFTRSLFPYLQPPRHGPMGFKPNDPIVTRHVHQGLYVREGNEVAIWKVN